MIVDTSSAVNQKRTKDPFNDVLLVRDLLQEELNELVIINQLVVRASNLLKEPLNVALKPFNFHDRDLKRMKFVSFELVEKITSTLAFLLNHLFELMFNLLVG